MKRFSLNFYAAVIVLVAGLGGCGDSKKEDNDSSPAFDLTNSKCLLNRQTYSYPNNTSYIRDLKYNANQQLIEVTDQYNFVPASRVYYTLEHNAQGQIRQVNRFLDGQTSPQEFYVYEHNADGQITRFSVFNRLRDPNQPQPQLYSYSELTYNNQKQLTSLRNFWQFISGPVLQSTTNFVYDNKGNVTNTTEHRVLSYQGSLQNSPDIVIKAEFTYDNKPNFYKENMNLAYVPTNPNLFILPHLSNNNQITAKQETTSEGTMVGPGNYNTGPLNFNRVIVNEYNEKSRAVKVIQQNGSFATNEFSCG